MQLVSSCNLRREHIVSKKTTEVHQQERPQENEGAATSATPSFWFNPPSRLTAASEDELRSHLGELLQERVVVLEWAFAPDGVRVSPDERREEPPKAGTMRGANPPRICRSPLDGSTLIDSMRL